MYVLFDSDNLCRHVGTNRNLRTVALFPLHVISANGPRFLYRKRKVFVSKKSGILAVLKDILPKCECFKTDRPKYLNVITKLATVDFVTVSRFVSTV